MFPMLPTAVLALAQGALTHAQMLSQKLSATCEAKQRLRNPIPFS